MPPEQSKSNPDTTPVDVAVIGLGLMGRSIAACLLAAGHRVSGLTNDVEASRDVPSSIHALLVEMRAECLAPSDPPALMQQFRMSGNIADLSRCEIVFESVTEDIDIKRAIFRQVEEIVPDSTIIASNTSAIPVSVLQEGALHPERIVGIHWDEPAHITRFMEIIPGKATDPALIQRVIALGPSWGKEPSLLKREIRGFITNRISYAMFREACHLVDSGVCTVEDVDRSLRNDVGWWMPFAGPFRYMDLMGVEAYFRVMQSLLPDLCTSGEIPPLIRNVVESGGRGVSNGQGFYHYTADEARQWQERFNSFNYKIRRLTSEYSDGPPSPPERKPEGGTPS